MTAVRLAAYDSRTGDPQTYEYKDGEALKAARCALGCMGVLLKVEMRTVAKYLVEETVRPYLALDDLLKSVPEHPLTQFILVPYRWAYMSFERRAVDMRALTAAERLKALFFRLYNTVWIDVGFHVLVKAAVAIGASAVKRLFRLLPYLMISKVTHLDEAEHVLTLGHYYFRHEEMELFVPKSRLREAVDLLHAATEVFAGETYSVPQDIETKLNLHKLYGDLIRNTGTYVQHYPFFFRRVLPEDTMISMASGATEPYYSISVFTYLPPDQRQHYYVFCSWLARAMNRLFGARLHWGKHFPLGAVEIARLYPELERFRQTCRDVDPNGVFRNDYTKRVLGFNSARQSRLLEFRHVVDLQESREIADQQRVQAPAMQLHDVAALQHVALLVGETELRLHGARVRAEPLLQVRVLVVAVQEFFDAAPSHGASSTRPIPVFQAATGS